MNIPEIHEMIKKLDDGGWDIPAAELDRPEDRSVAEALHAMYQHADQDVMALFVFLTFLASSTTEVDKDRTGDELRDTFIRALQGWHLDGGYAALQYFQRGGTGEDKALRQLAKTPDSEFFDWETYVNERRTDLTLLRHGPKAYLFKKVPA